MAIKLKSKLIGSHVHDYIYMGHDEGHLALNGRLIFTIEEWQTFGAALGLGAKQMRDVEVVFEGDLDIVEREVNNE